ncbi:conserved hypothetical protein [Theileria orientalis strain Shintoku]|uniref:Uncharacterized protein n=1 Tax=Theileria orientalis strain Shintoku TaxID=869250 RepID=J4C3S1_THEOR|nr:conserved hypothetical protein [Theileria orientalis strain Shintoku]BAM40931.1 conserved hypothetical protein [Theileria orientalis strain Shintoku]|eukprot:XP_009691232.1 conserved hypothetical protein [Theileria orientalis strain Shintoku]
MKLSILYIIGIILSKSAVNAVKNTSSASISNALSTNNSNTQDSDATPIPSETSTILAVSNQEDQLLDDFLFQGLVDGYTFTLDCVTMSKHEENHDLPNGKKASEKQLEKEHQQNEKEAKLDAEYMVKHRPLESTKVEKSEANLFHDFNILLHYLNSRGQEWQLVEPKDLHFEESNENHMLFKSEKNDSADIKIPGNMFYSVGNMKKTIPVHKDNKKPILLTCLESFIVSRLGFSSMNKLITSNAGVEDKLAYLKRWIDIAKKHYILYLPYIAITAPRCYTLLKASNDDDLSSDYSNNSHYKHLFAVSKKMLELRSDDGLLQTYIMLDSDLHPEIMRITLNEKHLFPLLLQEKENTLRTIHQHHNHEMDWDQFHSTCNKILAELEQQILTKYDKFLRPENWGIGLNAEESKNAEMELIKLFVKSQKELNFKVIQTVRKVTHQFVDKKKNDDNELKKSMIKFSKKEQEAAKRDKSTDKALEQCMNEAERQLDEDLKNYQSSNQSNIASKLKNFEHDSWMECVSSRIFDKFVSVCKNEDYCKDLMDKLDALLKEVDADSTAAIAMENFHYAVTVALLEDNKITVKDVKNHVLQISKQEIRDMSEPTKGSTASNSSSATNEEAETSSGGGSSSSSNEESVTSTSGTNETSGGSDNESEGSTQSGGASGQDNGGKTEHTSSQS